MQTFDGDIDTCGEDGGEKKKRDAKFLPELSLHDTDDGQQADWLVEMGDDYEAALLTNDKGQQRLVNGLADLPTADEYRSLSAAPEPDEWLNPEKWRTSPPFRAGAIHGDDPVASAEIWQREIPHLSKAVYNWIAADGYVIHPSSDAKIDEPRKKMTGPAQTELDRSILKAIQTGAVRWWDRETEGEPTFCTAVLSVPKKQSEETYRLITDYRPANERLKPWRMRYERISFLSASGARQGHWAFAMDFKSGYTAVKCGPARYFCFRARVRRSWLRALQTGDAGENTGVDSDSSGSGGTGTDGDDDWVETTLAWTALIMGMRTSAAIYTRIVRQIIKKWRKEGIAVLNYLDDTLFTHETREGLLAVIDKVVRDCEILQIPISFEKSCLVPVQRIVWCGWLLDFETGLLHIETKKATGILTLVAEARSADAVGMDVPLRKLAKILGKLISASRALMPARLLTRHSYALIRARTKAEWDAAVTLSPEARDELVFWAGNLLRWQATGRALFPQTRPMELAVIVDSGPEGWGARGCSTRLTDGADAAEKYEQWSPDESQRDQTEREMLGLERSLRAFGQDGVDYTDRVVRARLQSEEAADLLHLKPRDAIVALRVGPDGVRYSTDNTGVRKYINDGGGRSLRLNDIVRQIWLFLLERGARLDCEWIAGTAMIANGVDALSRRRWAAGAQWVWRAPALKQMVAWLRQQQGVSGTRLIESRQVSTGEAYTIPLDDGTVTVCFPGQNDIENWVTHLQQQRVLACIVVPLWHGPVMSTVERGLQARRNLGPAYKSFTTRSGEIPSWLIEAVLVDFGLGVVAPDKVEGWRPTHARGGERIGEAKKPGPQHQKSGAHSMWMSRFAVALSQAPTQSRAPTPSCSAASQHAASTTSGRSRREPASNGLVGTVSGGARRSWRRHTAANSCDAGGGNGTNAADLASRVSDGTGRQRPNAAGCSGRPHEANQGR